MIKIRTIHSGAFLLSRDRIEQVQAIFREAFPDMAGYAEQIPMLLRDPVQFGYRSALLVAEGAIGRLDGFALLLHFASANCVFLDFIVVRPGLRGGGVGSALYEAAREYCQRIGAKTLYMEVQPDTPELTPDPELLEEARKRVRFYEQYGVRAVKNAAYSLPVGDPPSVALLLYDGLGNPEPLGREQLRHALQLILTRRFGHVLGPEQVQCVLDAIKEDPVALRPLQHNRKRKDPAAVRTARLGPAFDMVVSPKHELHHVQERGYFERPIRVEAIRQALAGTGLFTEIKPRSYGEKQILAVHDADFVHYLRVVGAKLKVGRPIYPDTFPIRRLDRRPKALPVQAGYYCLDTGTPLYSNAYVAACAAVDTALTAADEIFAGKRMAYAVCRPPGHHAGRRFFGGFCYFNNAAIAAAYLGVQAKVAVLDVDFHHGNGTQDIFYAREDVLTLSIHGHPDYAYPYFSGYEYETGEGPGRGHNRNFPMRPKTEATPYLRTFERCLELVAQFGAEVLILSLGYDILRGDPTGTFLLAPSTLRTMGAQLAAFGRPLLVVQEGGYNIRNIRRGCAAFFAGYDEARP